MKLQTLDGHLLDKNQFKEYLKEMLTYAAENNDFNYPEFLYELRNKCEMTLGELLGYIHEIHLEQMK